MEIRGRKERKMNGLGELVDEIKDMRKELEKLNAKLDKLDTFDAHVVELTAVTKELIRVIKDKNI